MTLRGGGKDEDKVQFEIHRHIEQLVEVSCLQHQRIGVNILLWALLDRHSIGTKWQRGNECSDPTTRIRASFEYRVHHRRNQWICEYAHSLFYLMMGTHQILDYMHGFVWYGTSMHSSMNTSIISESHFIDRFARPEHVMTQCIIYTSAFSYI